MRPGATFLGATVLVALATLGVPDVDAEPFKRLPTRTIRKQPGARYARTIDLTFPDSTRFPHGVPFETGATDLRKGDSIRILEVLGTRPTFEVDGIYIVRGEYFLDSEPEARLALTVTATGKGNRCTHGDGRGVVTVQRGRGTFELASPIPYEGHPHVWFRLGDKSLGGVYFGKGAFLKR